MISQKQSRFNNGNVMWDDAYLHYEKQQQGLDGETESAFTPELFHRAQKPEPEDIDWLTRALEDKNKKWFVATLFSQVDSFPEGFFKPLMKAAIDEVNPSFNRDFVEPCLSVFGHRRINEYLLNVVETGTNVERAGAINALYWAQVQLAFQGSVPEYTFKYATPSSRTAYLSLKDIWERKRILLLQEFVSNDNIEVRRSIIPSLNFNPQIYPDSHQSLVKTAHAIASNHADEYIRHRYKVQIGEEQLLKPQPHRKKTMEKRPWWQFW